MIGKGSPDQGTVKAKAQGTPRKAPAPSSPELEREGVKRRSGPKKKS